MLTFHPVVSKMEGAITVTVFLTRAKITGGWLVAVVSGSLNSHTSVSFVPDPDHLWDGKSSPD